LAAVFLSGGESIASSDGIPPEKVIDRGRGETLS
jgi:hypothetical protein